jgi:hypothetical protein
MGARVKPRSADAMLDALRANEKDDALRERTARALEREGRHAESAQTLASAYVLLNAHGRGALPCLCKRCFVAHEARIELASGEKYRREFVVAERRALFFWVPDGLDKEAARVRASVRTAMREWLHRNRRPDRAPHGFRVDHETREALLRFNPFTGKTEADAMPPERHVVNPFARREPK